MSTTYRRAAAACGASSTFGGITIALLLVFSPAALAADPQAHEPQLQLGKYGAYVVVKQSSKLPKAHAQTVAPTPGDEAPVMAAAATTTDTTPGSSGARPAASEPDASAAIEREQLRDAAIEKQILQLMAAASLANAAAEQSSKRADQLLLPVWVAAICALISAFFATRALFENRKSLKSIRARLHTLSAFQKV